MSVHAITTTMKKIYTPKVPTMIMLTVQYAAPHCIYVGKDERAMTDYGILGADIIVNVGTNTKFLAKEPIYAMTPSGGLNIGVMEV